jgi:putative hemolysin
MRELPVPTLALSPSAQPRGSLHRTSCLDGTAPPVAPNTGAGITVSWARHLDEVRQAQRLRFDVFALEMGARLNCPIEGHDIDAFDDYCEHLLVRDAASTEVIGTYRVLTPAQAVRAGGLYSETEFDLSAVLPMRARIAELGRSCVHAKHRQGAVILSLWGALMGFMERNGLDVMVGCASIPMLHNGVVSIDAAASVWRQIEASHMSDSALRVYPHLALPTVRDAMVDVDPPALIKAYLRLGAKVLGAPAWDPDFNTADLPMLMRTQDLPARYRKHFASAR